MATVQPTALDAESVRLYAAFRDLSLPKVDWTHEAHLRVCWAVLSEHEPGPALDLLRDSIRTYNEATGVANTATGGYHESITRYYVEAIAQVAPSSLDELLHDELCQRDAPLRFWSRSTLMSVEARAAWVDPDVSPLPWASHRASFAD